MEDVFSVAYQQTEDEMDLEYAFFGIFDGHGGKEAAMFAKVGLEKFFDVNYFVNVARRNTSWTILLNSRIFGLKMTISS